MSLVHMKRNIMLVREPNIRLTLLSSLITSMFVLGGCGGGSEEGAVSAASEAANSQRESALAVTGWTLVAKEGQAFTLTSAQTVRYGSGSSWVQKTVSGTARCTNEFFGSDPLVGTGKQCEVADSAVVVADEWTKIANEWATFTVANNTQVRYGSGPSRR